MNLFTALKNLSLFHFTSLHFFHLSYQPFTSLHFAIHIYNSLPLTSLPFTFYRLHFPSLAFTFLTPDSFFSVSSSATVVDVN